MTTIPAPHLPLTKSAKQKSTNITTKRAIFKTFKIRGLTLQTSAFHALLNVLQREDPSQHSTLLHSLADELKQHILRSNQKHPIITKELIAKIISHRTRNTKDIITEAIQLLNAFQMPRIHYDVLRNQFSLLRDEKRSIHADAEHKVEMLQQRFALIQQRVLRQDCFRPALVQNRPSSSSSSSHRHSQTDPKTVLTPVEALLGRTGSHNLVGMLVQVEEHQYYLEDLSGQIPLDLRNAEILSDGFLCENCIVLVEGEMQENGFLRVDKMGSPPPESRREAQEYIGMKCDLFESIGNEQEMMALYEQEVDQGVDRMFVVLSEVHLDKPQTWTMLEKLFSGFSDASPLPLFVLMGNFTSCPIRASRDGGIRQVVGYFDQLGKLIAQFPNLAKEARFVFVPGPHDPGVSGGVLPHPPLPKFFTGGLKRFVKHVSFGSNPCRIRFFTREFVFFRQDIVGKLRTNSIVPCRQLNSSDDSENVTEASTNSNARYVDHAVQTVLDQGHLCPLPLMSAPVFWQYDHALRLYPAPDALILGDSRVGQFQRVCFGCDVMNPGSFSLDSSFVVYTPVEEDEDGEIHANVELSQID